METIHIMWYFWYYSKSRHYNNHAMYDHSSQGLGNLADSRDLAVTTSGNIRQIFRLLGISVKRKQFELPWYQHPGFTEFQYFHFLLILLFDGLILFIKFILS